MTDMSGVQQRSPSGLSLQRAFRIGAWLFLLLVLFLASALIYSGKRQLAATQRALQEQESDQLLDDVELQLRSHNRQGNIVSAGRADAYAPLWTETEQRLKRLLFQLGREVDTHQEVELFKRLDQQVARYLSTWEELRERGAAVEETIPRVRPVFDAALATLGRLKAVNLHQTTLARQDLESLTRSSTLIGALGIVAVLGGMLSVLVAFRKQIFSPLQHLSDAVDRLHGGDNSVCVPEEGVEEIRRIARSFNVMVASLNRYRNEQLAYLAGVAHDLRNPLSGMKLGLQLLRQEISRVPLGKSRTQILDKKLNSLDGSIDRLNYMTSGLLDTVKIEAGRFSLQYEELDLRQIAEEVVEFYTPTTNHRFLLCVPDKPVAINADRARMHQVIGNLVSNAIKYSPERKPIEVAIVVGDEVVLSVADYGVGIAPEDIREIFIPFHRGATTRDHVPGTGLGLSVVNRIVSAHGGRVEVQSSPGVGSTFRVILTPGGPSGQGLGVRG